MMNLRAMLEAADPLHGAPALATTDAREIRRQVLGAVTAPSPLSFPRALPVAALVVIMIVAGMAAGRRFATAQPRAGGEAAVSAPADGERRQVQFATPGGTKIIWTIDPNFQLRGMP